MGRGTAFEVTTDMNHCNIGLVKWFDNKAVTLGSNYVTSGDVDKVERWDKKKKAYVEIERPEIEYQTKLSDRHLNYLQDLNSLKFKCNDSQDMDQQFILDVIDLISDDDSVVETSLPKITKKMNLNRINYIQSDRQDIIFPGYNIEVFTELVNYFSSKQKNDKLQCQHSIFCTMGNVLNVFNPHTWMTESLMEHYFSLLAKSCSDQLILSLEPVFFKDLIKGGFDKATKSMRAPITNVFAYDKLITPIFLEGNHWTFTVPDDEQELDWTLNFGESPLQNNTYDCGVFTCTNARHVLLGKPLYFTQDDAPLLRHRITDSQDMDQQFILDVIDLISDDDSVVETSLPKITKKMNLNRINYIQSDRQDIIFPGYNIEVFTELVNYFSSKQKNDKLQCQHSIFCTMGNVLNVFNPHTWMTESLMEHYFSLLAKSCSDQLILSLAPVFFKDLLRGGFDKATKSMRATIKNVFAYDKLITPTYLEGNHWTFTVVNIKNRSITLYDSVKTSYYEDQINLLVEFLIEAYKKYEKPDNEQPLQWTLNFGNCPLQNNTYDCGVFTCTNARHVLLGKPLYYSQEDTPLLRHRITYEILHNVLLPTPDTL
ncbi:uncharacterized protein LOC113558122 [Rhopalosiphum maidis]|uniref:uncharacterized protein LOC113558122 n=1 Tax=Rhopalosiphum maidis TaxID=43146 RepID=UPI000EFF80E7|nr:uncharacterized protein LOC113558122 [Rhopalosiphum maidis]